MVPTEHGVNSSHFWRHFFQMLGLMGVGMVVAGFVLVRSVGLTSWGSTTLSYPTASLLVVAAGMTLPMVGWMLIRGMGRRNSAEMAAAMVLPVVPFLLVVWFGVTESAPCGAYCIASIVAMFALMRYRKDEYPMPK